LIQLSEISLPINHDEAALKKAATRALRVPPPAITSCTVIKQSIDARKMEAGVRFNYILHVTVSREEKELLKKYANNPHICEAPSRDYVNSSPAKATPGPMRPIIVGTGPCGMFAGLQLAKAGLKPILIERGKPAGPRARDVTGFWRGTSELQLDSNVQYGEGGAGTFSDGKLYTGIRDRENRIPYLLQMLVDHGAPEDILKKGKPHIGTDRLIKVVRNIRETIESLGGEYRFETRVTGLHVENGKIRGVITADGGEVETDKVILAVGHSARDVFEMLHEMNVPMEAKPFSIGARIEHPQSMIDRTRYGKNAGDERLGAAAYKFVYHCGRGTSKTGSGRAAYSFCMCPGGLVVAASSEANTVVTNGMSSYARADANANSGFMIDIFPEDYSQTGHPLAGIRYQQKLERKAFELGGSDYKAPAQLLGDFLAKKPSTEIGNVEPSYRPGVTLCDLHALLPQVVTDPLRASVSRIARQLPGFDRHDAILTAVETRSSSPLRITRDPDTLQSPAIEGLYPAGEGAGYAGGIISAAVDGLRITEAILAVK
jgi:uncharacterized FAD-dependent dehydrogenase